MGAAVAFAEPEAKPKADADPYLLYGGYGYGHLGYRGYYGYPYAHHGLAYYGKRSADAEPKADADPYLLMVDMDMDTLDMPDTTDTHMLMDMLTTESALLMPSPRLMLTLTFRTEDMDMDTLDTGDTTDTHMVDMPTTDKL